MLQTKIINNLFHNYDVVITISPIDELTGHIFECFDYYLFLRQHCKVGILFINNIAYDKIKAAFNDKYNIDFSTIESDIKNINNNNTKYVLVFNSNTTILLCDGNIVQLENCGIQLICKKIFAFLCAENEVQLSHKYQQNIIYLADYRIYQNINNLRFKTLNYVKKLPFKFYKTVDKHDINTGMMYLTNACRKITRNTIIEYHEKSGCSNTILIVPEYKEEYSDIDNITQYIIPVDDFFNKFDTYIYTPVNRKFDCSPRLVTECFMHRKNIIIDIPYADIGLQTRYNDCKTNINNLNLTDNDDILKYLNINKK